MPRACNMHLPYTALTPPSCSFFAFFPLQKAKGLPVQFHVGVPAQAIEQLLASALVQWHLTGIDLVGGQADPASEEHFGISIAEGEGVVRLGCAACSVVDLFCVVSKFCGRVRCAGLGFLFCSAVCCSVLHSAWCGEGVM